MGGLIILRGLWIFCSKRKHLLLTLLRLEYMVLGVFFIIVIRIEIGALLYSLVYLIFGACEGALGLSILVTMRRTHGGDNFNIFNLNYDKIYYSISKNYNDQEVTSDMMVSENSGLFIDSGVDVRGSFDRKISLLL